jgi:hypothetical protein
LEADSVRARSPSLPALLLLGLIGLPAVATFADVRVFTADEVRARFIVQRGSASYLVVDDSEWELVTDTADPVITNAGDGSFHPMSAAHVKAAVRHVGSFTRALEGKILILPYPRRSCLKSSCEQGAIFLSPGVLEVVPEHVHAVTCHEIGHLFQGARVPQGSLVWQDYVDLRDLHDPRYHDRAIHRDRPREIFAEDFRFLFGTALARSSGSIENPNLPLPTEIPGLRTWFQRTARVQNVVAAGVEQPRPLSYPNPFHGEVGGRIFLQFPLVEKSPSPAAGQGPAEVFDAAGRRVRTLTEAGTGGGGGVVFVWDGRNARGTDVAPGLYFVRLSTRPALGTARVHILR